MRHWSSSWPSRAARGVTAHVARRKGAPRGSSSRGLRDGFSFFGRASVGDSSSKLCERGATELGERSARVPGSACAGERGSTNVSAASDSHASSRAPSSRATREASRPSAFAARSSLSRSSVPISPPSMASAKSDSYRRSNGPSRTLPVSSPSAMRGGDFERRLRSASPCRRGPAGRGVGVSPSLRVAQRSPVPAARFGCSRDACIGQPVRRRPGGS